MTLAALSLSLLLASGTSAVAPYAVVSGADDPLSALLLVDTRSLAKTGGTYQTAVFLSVFPQEGAAPTADAAQSYVAEADCRARQLRFRDLVTYPNTGAGRSVPVAPSPWRVQHPGTTGDRMISLMGVGDGEFLVPLDGSVSELITLLHKRP